MAGYVIVQINITNKDKYGEYIDKVKPIVKKYGGEYLVRGGKKELMLGKWDYERTVVIKFPSSTDLNNTNLFFLIFICLG